MGWQQIEYSICLWMRIFGQNLQWCGRNIRYPHLSLVSTSTALPSVMRHRLPSLDGTRDVRIPEFFPRVHRFCPKNFQTCLPYSASLWWLRHSPVTKPLWSDHKRRYTVLCLRFHGSATLIQTLNLSHWSAYLSPLPHSKPTVSVLRYRYSRV